MFQSSKQKNYDKRTFQSPLLSYWKGCLLITRHPHFPCPVFHIANGPFPSSRCGNPLWMPCYIEKQSKLLIERMISMEVNEESSIWLCVKSWNTFFIDCNCFSFKHHTSLSASTLAKFSWFLMAIYRWLLASKDSNFRKWHGCKNQKSAYKTDSVISLTTQTFMNEACLKKCLSLLP